MQNYPSSHTEFLFQDGNQMDENKLMDLYEKRFSELIALIESNQLIAYVDRFPDTSICKNNTAFMIRSCFTYDATRIIKEMRGGKYGQKQKKNLLKKIGKFEYLDGQFREEKTLKMRVVKVAKSYKDFNEDFKEYQKYVLVHFYIIADEHNPGKIKNRVKKSGRDRIIDSDEEIEINISEESEMYIDEESEVDSSDSDESQMNDSDENDLDESYRPPLNQRQKRERKNQQPKEQKPSSEQKYQIPNKPVNVDSATPTHSNSNQLIGMIAKLRKELHEENMRSILLKKQYLDLTREIIQEEQVLSSKTPLSSSYPMNHNKAKCSS